MYVPLALAEVNVRATEFAPLTNKVIVPLSPGPWSGIVGVIEYVAARLALVTVVPAATPRLFDVLSVCVKFVIL